MIAGRATWGKQQRRGCRSAVTQYSCSCRVNPGRLESHCFAHISNLHSAVFTCCGLPAVVHNAYMRAASHGQAPENAHYFAAVPQLHHQQLVQLLHQGSPCERNSPAQQFCSSAELASQAPILKLTARAWWWHIFHSSANSGSHICQQPGPCPLVKPSQQYHSLQIEVYASKTVCQL